MGGVAGDREWGEKVLGVGWELAYIEDKMIDVGIAVG
jgi:hypothetical protein